MMLYLVFFHFVLNFMVIIDLFANHADDAVDAKLLLKASIFKGIHAAQKEVAFVALEVARSFKDIDDITTVPEGLVHILENGL